MLFRSRREPRPRVQQHVDQAGAQRGLMQRKAERAQLHRVVEAVGRVGLQAHAAAEEAPQHAKNIQAVPGAPKGKGVLLLGKLPNTTGLSFS